MNVDKLLAESLLEDRVASRRGLEALLAFWRRYRHQIPDLAQFDDQSLEYLQECATDDWDTDQDGPLLDDLDCDDPEFDVPVCDPEPTVEEEIAALMLARALWSQIEAILDTPGDDLAVAALETLVNGPNRAAMSRFYIGFGGLDKSLGDPVYVAYSASFYVPFLRHGYRHLT